MKKDIQPKELWVLCDTRGNPDGTKFTTYHNKKSMNHLRRAVDPDARHTFTRRYTHAKTERNKVIQEIEKLASNELNFEDSGVERFVRQLKRMKI